MTTLIVKHNAGFFSCCSVRLHMIIEFFNAHQRLPASVDSSAQFRWYKVLPNGPDITFQYFQLASNGNIHYTKMVNYIHDYQYINYFTLDYEAITPFITKYFSPSDTICAMMAEIQNKYAIDYENTCALFYRGNDKCTETKLGDYSGYITYGKVCLQKNPLVRFLIQSDETEFIARMLQEFPNNSFFMKDEIRHMPRCINTVDRVMKRQIDIYSKKYLAITIIMSKCKYVICGSGNCSIWIMLYRGNANNVCQYLKDRWLYL